MLLQRRATSLTAAGLALSVGIACGGSKDAPKGHDKPAKSEKTAAKSGLPSEANKTKPKAEPNKPPAKPKAEVEQAPTGSVEDIKYPEPFNGKVVNNTKLESGVVVDDFVVGDGQAAGPGSEVEVHYTGYLLDGTVFDSSIPRNRAFKFPLGARRVIGCWDQGVAGMKIGGKRRLTCPADTAYGKRRAGKIPPNATLVFTVELLSATPPPPPPKGDEAYKGKPVKTDKRKNGLEIYDYALGKGEASKSGDMLVVHYTGRLDDGTVFDSSVPRGRPFTFPVGRGRVIKGWDEGMVGMKVGGLRKLVIPSELAYGERERKKIPANSRLTFTVELMEIKGKK